ncbi:MAG: hypothetical protein LBI18_09260 [Planctomycetaceae bacterium]|nr:hypothetical protein [Planctomycetaceae bacterium]
MPQGNSDSVFGWQLDSKPLGNTNYQPKTEASRLAPTRPFGERSPTSKTGDVDSKVGDVSPKHHPS